MSEKNLAKRSNNSLVHQKEDFYGEGRIFEDSNKVWVSGKLEKEFEYSHETYGEKYYKNRVIATRNSGTEDCIPIVVSERTIPQIQESLQKGRYVEVGGTLRTYNRYGEDGKSHLNLVLFVSIINFYETEEEIDEINANNVYLDGYVCKEPTYRMTPSGREITDLLLAVNGKYNRSSYICCIVWGRNAKYAGEFKIGDRVQMYGRLQSRTYIKRNLDNPDEGEERETYEVSVSLLTKVNSDSDE